MRNCLAEYSYIFVVLCISIKTSCEAASQQRILAFTSEIWEQSPVGKWKTDTAFPKGTLARLSCITSSTTSSTFRLRNYVNTEAVLEDLDTEYAEHQLIHEFGSIDCHQMGTYVCENKDDAEYTNSSIDVGINGCEPHLCDGQDSTQTIFASANDTKIISTCVVAYPEISHFEYLGGSLGSTLQEPTSQKWSKQIERRSFNTFTVQMTLHELSEEDFGSHVFSISTSYEEKRKTLELRVDLRPEGPPECPTDIKLSKMASDSAMLSWQPGSHRGAEQSFQVFYTEGDGLWQTYGKPTLGNSMVLTGLREDTSYVFRVVSLNKFTPEVLHNLCNDTVEKIAEVSTEAPSAQATDMGQRGGDGELTTAGTVLGVVIAIVAVIVIVGLLVFIKWRKVRSKMLSSRHTHLPTHMLSNSNSSQESKASSMGTTQSQQFLIKPNSTTSNQLLMACGDRYISEQGLLYVTVDHSSNQSPRDRSRPRQPVQDTVQYATLDLQKSGKYGINDLKQHKSAKMKSTK